MPREWLAEAAEDLLSLGKTQQEDDELWPLLEPPCPGELFSSWLIRLSRLYELPIDLFCRAIWPGREIWRGDIDRQIDDEVLNLLSRKTGVPYAELFSMTLRSHEQCACSAGCDSALDLYVHVGTAEHATRYCPSCLDDRRPYFRLQWRLAFVTMCGRHRRPLLEQCGYCKAPCLFSKLDLHYPLGFCHRCHKYLPLVCKEFREEDSAVQIDLHIDFQETILSLLRRTPVNSGNAKPRYDAAFAIIRVVSHQSV
jgi:TniQ